MVHTGMRVNVMAHYQLAKKSQGVGISQISLATANGNTSEVRPAYVQTCNLKQRPFKIISSEVQDCTSTDFWLK